MERLPVKQSEDITKRLNFGVILAKTTTWATGIGTLYGGIRVSAITIQDAVIQAAVVKALEFSLAYLIFVIIILLTGTISIDVYYSLWAQLDQKKGHSNRLLPSKKPDVISEESKAAIEARKKSEKSK